MQMEKSVEMSMGRDSRAENLIRVERELAV